MVEFGGSLSFGLSGKWRIKNFDFVISSVYLSSIFAIGVVMAGILPHKHLN
jgi:hypothetical protein